MAHLASAINSRVLRPGRARVVRAPGLSRSLRTSPLTGVTVHSIRADRLALRLTGLPAAFVLTKSDWLSINDGTNRHLLRAVEGGITAGTGLSPWFEVRPGLRPSIATGQPVTLRYAPALFMVDPGSVQRTPASRLRDTVSWTATQVIL